MSVRVFGVPITAVFPPSEAGGCWRASYQALWSSLSLCRRSPWVTAVTIKSVTTSESTQSHSVRVEPGGNRGGSHVGKVVSRRNQDMFWGHEATEIMSNDHLFTRREQSENISNKREDSMPQHKDRELRLACNFKLTNFD